MYTGSTCDGLLILQDWMRNLVCMTRRFGVGSRFEHLHGTWYWIYCFLLYLSDGAAYSGWARYAQIDGYG